MEINKIYLGNCLQVMGEFDDNSIDSIITDPPYGLKFMNKKWDYDVPGVEVFQEMLRVVKPGAFLLCFGGSRTFHRMAVNIEDAGWEIRDTIMWLYGSGFPKSYNISKGIDKKMGAEREVIGQNQDILKKQAKDIKEGKRKITDSFNAGAPDRNNGFKTISADITAPATPEAELWDGYGTALKPAFEPIIVAMKPVDKNFVNNALTHGVAGLNIDGSRIETDDNLSGGGLAGAMAYDGYQSFEEMEKACLNDPEGKSPNGRNNKNIWKRNKNKKYKNNYEYNQSSGRFPANIILDEAAGEMLDEQSGILKSGSIKPHHKSKGLASSKHEGYKRPWHEKAENIGWDVKANSGGASRFFYCAKASKSERNAGLEDNNHPTVKPLILMEYLTLDVIEYLCTLTKTPTGGIVLDPFAGSGTTGCACINTNRDFILIENEKEHIPIIKARIEHYRKIKKEKLFS